jgi:hypothetical protein
MLGFHSNFYHSWRGDTPDEAGFGTDIRIVRALLRMLNEAEARGLEARAYWDTDNHFTLEQILPDHAPDIIDGIRRRVASGSDEILLAPYNNGLFHAMTEDEMRAAVRWSVRNPWGSGTEDLFGTYTPLIRPHEGMLTAGTIPILQQEGVAGVVLAYSGWPFTTFSNFVPALPAEQRYNPTWLRLRPDGPRTVLLPSVSVGDVINHVSLEKWLLELRELQTSGQVDRDLLLHINFDADVETWLPQDLPPGLGWFPNAGGLPEYIEAVNKYAWAGFTTPGRYLEKHTPVGEVLVRQDLADGAYDGQYSWAEKLPSHELWTQLEQSRLAARRAAAWSAEASIRALAAAESLLRKGTDSSFFRRLVALSTTHFGMSTPLVNEERQDAAERVVADARARAQEAEWLLAWAAREWAGPADDRALYVLRVRDVRQSGPPAHSLVRVPLLFRGPAPRVAVLDGDGLPVPSSQGAPERAGGLERAELLAFLKLAPGQARTLRVVVRDEAPREPHPSPAFLELPQVTPFVTYKSDDRPRRHEALPWTTIPERTRDGFAHRHATTRIKLPTPDGEKWVELRADWRRPPGVSWLVADVEVTYPYTEKRDLLHTNQQKLRRYMDMGWVEVAPFELTPALSGTRDDPLRVWKHNYLGVTSSFDLDYARINPNNAELDAFNHQVTAAWVALSDGERGLLLAQSADVRSAYAFAPMRLREVDGRQEVRVNPFGSYHGRQLDYSHLGGTGLGAAWSNLRSSSLRPNGPSYNGARERFSLLVANYDGDAPPEALQADAEAFFHPPALLILKSPFADDVLLRRDLEMRFEATRRVESRHSSSALPAPRAFLANPSDGAVDLVWDESEDPRLDGYEVVWRRADPDSDVASGAWSSVRIARARRHRVSGLPNGESRVFRIRALGRSTRGEVTSPWTPDIGATANPIPPLAITSATEGAPLGLKLRTFYWGLVHLFTTP